MKIKRARVELDANGNIRNEDNMVTIFVDTEDGNSIRLFCKINLEQHTIAAFNIAFRGIYCPCCNSNAFTCTSLYNKRHEILREAYEFVKEKDPNRLKLLLEPVGNLNVVQ
ncbi:hypothetical protein ACFQZ1_14605 [Bacillus sp. CGMCC 1.60114]|uniref:hypothetical protein n=1 Tax=unclassified Bacillus (in: firmicutes) TaxID=185979 RepID=UPI00363238FD